MKDRIIALAVGMILLLFSSLFSQLRIPEGLDFIIGAGRYWINLKDTKSSTYYDENYGPLGYYEIVLSKFAGYYIETGLEYRFFRISSLFYRYEHSLSQKGWGGIMYGQHLTVNSFSIQGYLQKDIFPNLLYVNGYLGTGLGWGDARHNVMIVKTIENYSFEPKFCFGSGIDVRFWEIFDVHCTGEYEILRFDGNPSFVLDNWNIKSGIRLIL